MAGPGPLAFAYFTFGSNLFLPRLEARIGPFQVLGSTAIRGRELRFHKRGSDGSGKADCAATDRADAVVHGMVYRIAQGAKTVLDEIEGVGHGYQEAHAIAAVFTAGEVVAEMDVYFYEAQPDYLDPALKPFDWYHQYVVRGAMRHRLPHGYIEELQRVRALPDPDTERANEHWDRLIRC